MQLGVVWVIEWCSCHLTPTELQSSTFYWATLGAYLLPFCLDTLPNVSLVANCVALYFSTPPKYQLHMAVKLSQTTAIKSIPYGQYYSMAASSQISPYDLLLLSPSAEFYFDAVSNGSTCGYWTDALSPQTQPPILFHACWTHINCPAIFLWNIGSRRIQFGSGRFSVCLLYCLMYKNHCFDYLHHIHSVIYLAMGASLQLLWHLFSIVQHVAVILLLGGYWGGLPGGLEGSGGGGVEVQDIGRLTGLFLRSAGGTLGVPGDDGHTTGNCEGRKIWDPPHPPGW